jgi:drug/metabolite transporter (DMT)-like permease
LLEAVFLGLLTALMWGSGDFLTRRPMAKIGYYFTTGYVQFFGFLGFTILALVVGDSFSTVFASPTVLVLNIVAGLLNFLGILFLYRGFSTGLMSVVSPIAGSYPAITVVFSVLFFGLVVGFTVGIGIAMVILGVALSSIKVQKSMNSPEEGSQAEARSEPKRKWKLVKGVDSALVACVSFGSLYLVLRFVSPVFGLVLPIVVMRASAAACTFLLFRPLAQEFKAPLHSTLPLLVFIGLIDTGGYIALNEGLLLSSGNLPVVVTLSSMASLVVVTLASLFYKERLDRYQGAGVLCVILGVAIIINS